MDNRRKTERKKLLAFTPVYDAKHNSLLGYLQDLTLQGAMLVGEKAIEINTNILLAINFPETVEFPAQRVKIPAHVAWSKQEKNSPYCETGLEFQEVSEGNRKIVEAILIRYQFRREMPT